MITLDTEKQAVVASLEVFLSNVRMCVDVGVQYTQESIKWGKTAYDMGVEETLKMLPLNNPVHVLLDTAYKLRDRAIAHTQSLNVGMMRS